MKRIISVTLSILILSVLLGVSTFAAGNSATVYVTICDKDGALAVAYEPLTATDTDGDGALTVSDALFAAHEAKYDGGAAAGYNAEYGSFGLSLAKLWGCANGGSYGYYVNGAMAWSLGDPVKDGDHVHAFIYRDLSAFSDKFSYFDKTTVSAAEGDEIELTLTGIDFNEFYETVKTPIKSAVITVNGERTSFVTDADGKAKITLENAGEAVISAVSDAEIIVAPVCKAAVEAKAAPSETENSDTENAPVKESAPTGDPIIILSAVAAASLLTIVAVSKKKKVDEN